MKVLVLHSRPPQVARPGRNTGEFDLAAAAEGIAEVLPSAIVAGVSGDVGEVTDLIARYRPAVIFNACEAPLGRPDLEPHVASLFEWLGVRFTGARSETLMLCRRKDRTKAVLASAGVRVPRSAVFPCIVKPADEDGSAGIDAGSICENADAAARAAERCGGRVLLEEFLPGREFAVSLWGRDKPEHVSIGETLFQNGQQLNTYEAKWDVRSAAYANSPLSYDSALAPRLRKSITTMARLAWHAVGARGYLRMDVRLDTRGRPAVLDVNPNPELGPGVGIRRAVEEAGWSWSRFVRKQVEWA